MTSKAKGEELEESSIVLSSSGSSEEDLRLKGNRTVKDQRMKRKRRYSSTDSSTDSSSSSDSDSVSSSSYSSSDSDSSSSSSGSDSDSGSSETSLSSDYRHKHRKKSRKDEQGHDHGKINDLRQQKEHKKKPTPKLNRSSGRSSISQIDHSNSTSDAKKSDKRSLQASHVSIPAAVLTKEKAVTRLKIDVHMNIVKNASDENNGASNRELPENDSNAEVKSDKLVNQSPNPDKNLSRHLMGNSEATPRGSPRRGLASRVKIDDHMSIKMNASDVNDGASNKELPENDSHVEVKSVKLVNQSPNPDKNLIRHFKRNSDASPRGSPRRDLASRLKIDYHMSIKKEASDENDGASNRELPGNDSNAKVKSDNLVNQSPNHDKNLSSNLKGNSDPSPRGSPRRELASAPNDIHRLGASRLSPERSPMRELASAPNDIHRLGAGRSSPERSPRPKASEPMSNKCQNVSQETSPNGAPKRIRKGRGFTKEFAYVRKYRSPSPDISPLRSRYNWRCEEDRDRNRYSRYRSYTEHSAARYLRGSPRGSSPLRYQSRRARSRSTSPRSVRYRAGRRDHSRSPRRNRSPLRDQKPTRSDRDSRLDPKGNGHEHDAYRRSKSRSLDSPASKYPGRKQKEEESKGSMRDHSSSSRSISPGKNGLVSYGRDGSPDQ